MSASSQIPNTKPHGRSYYVDNLKAFLTVLVIYHHTAAMYGGEGSVPYRSSLHPRASSVTLIGLNVLNQTYFMGLFFYLSGYFTSQAMQRKTPRQCLLDRVYRLGLPTVVYSLIGPPMCELIVKHTNGQRPYVSTFLGHWITLRGVRGPVWYTATLLLFDAVNATASVGLRRFQRQWIHRNAAGSGMSQTGSVMLAIFVCAAASFTVRLYYPIGTNFGPLSLQVGYVPQYSLAYLYGTLVTNIEDMIPSRSLSACLAGLVGIWTRFLLYDGSLSAYVLESSRGGWSRAAMAYALWNETTGYIMAAIMVLFFRNVVGGRHRWICQNAFPAFLVHMPLLVAVGVSTDQWSASGGAKTAVVGSIGVILSWALGAWLAKAWSATLNLSKGCFSIGSELK